MLALARFNDCQLSQKAQQTNAGSDIPPLGKKEQSNEQLTGWTAGDEKSGESRSREH